MLDLAVSLREFIEQVIDREMARRAYTLRFSETAQEEYRMAVQNHISAVLAKFQVADLDQSADSIGDGVIGEIAPAAGFFTDWIKARLKLSHNLAAVSV